MLTIRAALAFVLLGPAAASAVEAPLFARATRMTLACESNAELTTIARLRREGRIELSEAAMRRAIAIAACRAIPPGERLAIWGLQRDPSYGDLYLHRRRAGEPATYVRAADLEPIDP